MSFYTSSTSSYSRPNGTGADLYDTSNDPTASSSSFNLPTLTSLRALDHHEGTSGGGGFFTSNQFAGSEGVPMNELDDSDDEDEEGEGEESSTPVVSSGGGGGKRPRKKIKTDGGGGGEDAGFGGDGLLGSGLGGYAASAGGGGTETNASSRAGSVVGGRKKATGGAGGKKATGKGKGKNKVLDGNDTATGEDDGEMSSATVGGGKKAAAGKATSTSTTKPRKINTGDKKKKAGRACAACQKAHLTCDDARPCARCVKKGCPELCHDGTRKKAKYLQEIPDELLERRPPIQPSTSYQQVEPVAETPMLLDGSQVDSESPQDGLLPSEATTSHLHQQQQQQQAPPFSFDTMPFYSDSFTNEFGSEAANLEYAILSSMLNGNGFAVDTYGASTGPATGQGGDSMLLGSPMGNGGTTTTTNGTTNGTTSTSNGFLGSSYRPPASSGAGTNGGGGGVDLFSPSPHAGPSSSLKPDLSALRSTSNDESGFGGGGGGGEQRGLFDEETTMRGGDGGGGGGGVNGNGAMTAEEAYRTVTKPYPYAQSYHYLVKHLKQRFEKNDILRIIRALATFRPSLIALQMPLTEEDETFVERTFQRTLVELNKLISFSGTPTVVWRRTGEICLVGTEFCLLTGWSREELLGKKYIFELLDTASVVELYEQFARHAFESTSSSVTMQAVVLGPTGRPVPCAFCFSIRRDLFSCPFLIIGSFLPILV